MVSAMETEAVVITTTTVQWCYWTMVVVLATEIVTIMVVAAIVTTECCKSIKQTVVCITVYYSYSSVYIKYNKFILLPILWNTACLINIF